MRRFISTVFAITVGTLLIGAALGEEPDLANKNLAELLAMPRSEAVCRTILSRAGVAVQYRQEALAELARLNRSDELTQLLAAIERLDAVPGNEADDALHDLTHLLTGRYADQLLTARQWLEKSSQEGRHAILRQAACVALLTVDRSIEPTWRRGSKSAQALRDVIEATPFVGDLNLRAALYPKLASLVNDSADSFPADASEAEKRDLRRAAIDAISYIGGHETETAKTLAGLILAGTERETAVRSLRRIPRAFWPKQEIGPLVDCLIGYLNQLPVVQRPTPGAIEAAQLCRELALLLPPEQGDEARAAIDGFKIRAILIRPTPHHMTYDREKIYVQVGQPVEIVFQNTELVPHSLVIAAPGTSAEVGQLAETMSGPSDAGRKNFVPDSPKVLQSTRMLSFGEVDTLRFIAPETPGVYGIVCTFPGRWRTMYGALHVVPELASVPVGERFPDAPLQSAPRPFVRDWKYDELASDLAQVDRGRSFERGKYLYGVLACGACHQLSGTSTPPGVGLVGPDLTDVRKRFKRSEILRDLLEPSKVINEKFQTQLIETGDGEIVTGIVVREDATTIRLLKDPRESCEPKDIRKDNIESQQASKISMMPVGQMTTLTKEEIFDLLAYVESGGDSSAAMFKE
jgi:putative heme-binding domain-containing protein